MSIWLIWIKRINYNRCCLGTIVLQWSLLLWSNEDQLKHSMKITTLEIWDTVWLNTKYRRYLFYIAPITIVINILNNLTANKIKTSYDWQISKSDYKSSYEHCHCSIKLHERINNMKILFEIHLHVVMGQKN